MSKDTKQTWLQSFLKNQLATVISVLTGLFIMYGQFTQMQATVLDNTKTVEKVERKLELVDTINATIQVHELRLEILESWKKEQQSKKQF